MGNLYIYTRSSANNTGALGGTIEGDHGLCNHDNCTLIHTIIGSEVNSNFTKPSAFQQVKVSLDGLKNDAVSLAQPNFHSILFVFAQNTGFLSDFCIDNIAINEVT